MIHAVQVKVDHAVRWLCWAARPIRPFPILSILLHNGFRFPHPTFFKVMQPFLKFVQVAFELQFL